MENTENIIFECLWKKTINEIIINNNENYQYKIALILLDQKLNKQEFNSLEENNWTILEIESIMKEASQEELKIYINDYFKDMVRIQEELKAESPEELTDELQAIKIKNKEETIDSFLN